MQLVKSIISEQVMALAQRSHEGTPLRWRNLLDMQLIAHVAMM